MKKLLIVVIAVIGFSKANSQLYLQAGANLANISDSKSGATESNNLLVTFNAGFLGRFNVYSPLSLETGLLLMGEGSKADTYFTGSRSDNYVRTKFNPLYLQLPLNLVIKVPFQKHAGIFFNAGPYVQMGIGGTSKSDSKFLGVESSSSNDIKFNNDNPSTSTQEDAAYDKLKRFDLGLNLGGGFDFGKVLLKVNYEIGFTKINSTETNNSADDKNKFRTVSISLGFNLHR